MTPLDSEQLDAWERRPWRALTEGIIVRLIAEIRRCRTERDATERALELSKAYAVEGVTIAGERLQRAELAEARVKALEAFVEAFDNVKSVASAEELGERIRAVNAARAVLRSLGRC